MPNNDHFSVVLVRRSNLELPDSVVDPSHHFLCDNWNVEMRQTMTYFTSSCHRRVGGSHVQVKLNVHGDKNLSPLLLALTVVGFDSLPNLVTNSSLTSRFIGDIGFDTFPSVAATATTCTIYGALGRWKSTEFVRGCILQVLCLGKSRNTLLRDQNLQLFDVVSMFIWFGNIINVMFGVTTLAASGCRHCEIHSSCRGDTALGA